MAAIWCSLSAIVLAQYSLMKHTTTTTGSSNVANFWLVSFPFAIHFGWITVATALNINVLVINQGYSAAAQLALSIVSIAAIHTVSVWVLFALEQPNYTVAAVVAWATWWIFCELQAPKELIVQTFSIDVIEGFGYPALIVSVLVLTQIASRVFVASMKLLKKSDEEGNSADVVDSSHNGIQQDGDNNSANVCGNA